VTALDEFGHLPVEKSQQQRTDMRAVDIGVRHDDDAVVAQFVGIEIVAPDAAAECRDQGPHLGR